MPNILIAGGGSGGHVAPAIAVAEALHDKKCNAILAHSTRDVDSLMTKQTPFKCITIPASPLSLNPIGFVRFCNGFRKSEKIVSAFIKENGIECVLSTGGFIAAPALRAAKKQSCPTVLLNLDNPPGKANRLAVRWADTVLSTVECGLPNSKRISPPLRQCVIGSSNVTNSYEKFGLDSKLMTLLVTGASQGATTINELVPALAKRNPNQFRGWQILHVAGTGHSDKVKESWKDLSIPCHVVDFVDEMGLAWNIADLAITRGGANTIAELAINAVPAVILPYPYHKDDHQKTNAEKLASVGGVVVEKDFIQVSQNIDCAGNTILKLLKNHQQRLIMRQAIASLSTRNGSIAIADTCIASVCG
jgi:UDP-N-acetylglucosamine:LPS N-acetylglucosamine transferase